MYKNYTLYAYDSKFNCVQEWSFEDVCIESAENTISVFNKNAELLYAISTNCCTVIVMENDLEG